jgi:starvation-inducible DNA-binding protein
MRINIGIDEESRKQIAEGLKKLTADTFTLYLKTHYYHWNVTGPMFETLHKMFEEQYNALWQAVDTLAERIRALGFYAPGTYRELMSTTSIQEDDDIPGWKQMIQNLLDGHEEVIRSARDLFPQADEAGDEGTADLLTCRLEFHEKTAWMLRSMLESD